MKHWVYCISLATVCVALLGGCQGCRPQEKQNQEQGSAVPDSTTGRVPLAEKLTDEISQNPDNPELYFTRSKAYLKLGNYEKALADIKTALEKDSTAGRYYTLLSEIYYAKQEYARAILTLEKGRREAPDDTQLALLLAKYKLFAGEKSKSIQLLDEVLKKNMFNAEAYFLKGMIFKEVGDTAKSISNFQTAVEQNPKYYEAYMQLGLLFSRKKDKLALDYFSNALKIDSMSYEARYGIAMFFQQTGDYGRALEEYRNLILRFPQERDAYYNTGYIYFQIDSIDRADRHFERAISVDPVYADAYYMRGLCAEAKKDSGNAQYFYRQTLKLKPDHQLAASGLKRLGQTE